MSGPDEEWVSRAELAQCRLEVARLQAMLARSPDQERT